ncbi:hypothetical protein MNBD_GAMMA03-246 [hydrothermal vent metagenome]|uniref:Polysaccharide biosynthesis protein C-terminal domain-containing protein n=1 Tax=hydrothermal vent metagenome TaxID=652676 RepID=A0A3B0VQU1_9ZZZZ
MSLRKNSTYNLIGSVAPLFITLITLPIYIGLIGEERFGVLAIAWVLLGYFGLFDLGLGRATAQRLATQKNANSKDRSETFWTAIIINLGFGVAGGLLLWPVAHVFFTNYFQVSEQLRSEIIAAVPWLVLALPVATLSGVLTGTLQGREKFLVLNAVNLIGNLLFQVIPLLFAWLYSPKLTTILPIVLLSRLLTLNLLFICCQKYVPLVGRPLFVKGIAMPLFKFGGWVTVTSIVGPIMMVFDKFIIGTLLGAKMVAYYTIPYTLAERVLIIPSSLASALFPRLASESSYKEQKRLTEESVKVLSVVLTPIIVIGIFVMKPFIAWWLSPEFSIKTSYVGSILLLGIWVNSLATIPLARIQAKGRPDIVAKIHMFELLPYVFSMYFAISNWGIIGASIVWSLRAAVDCILLFIFSDISKEIISLFLFPAIILVVSIIMIFNISEENILYTVAVVILGISVFWSYINIPDSLMGLIKKKLRL